MSVPALKIIVHVRVDAVEFRPFAEADFRGKMIKIEAGYGTLL